MPDRFAFALVALALAAHAILVPAQAGAQNGIAAAREAYESADFEAALALLADAERGDGLSHEEVVELIELRAELHFAIGDEAAMERDVLQRVAVDPEHPLPSTAPPELRTVEANARARITGPIVINLEASLSPGGLVLDAEVGEDPAGVVREVRISARSGDGTWRTSSSPWTVESSSPVDYYAEAVGPGGLVLAEAGSRAAPRTWGGDGRGRRGGNDDLWIGLGIAGAVLAVGAVVTVLVVVLVPSGPSDQTQPQLPVIVSF